MRVLSWRLRQVGRQAAAAVAVAAAALPAARRDQRRDRAWTPPGVQCASGCFARWVIAPERLVCVVVKEARAAWAEPRVASVTTAKRACSASLTMEEPSPHPAVPWARLT